MQRLRGWFATSLRLPEQRMKVFFRNLACTLLTLASVSTTPAQTWVQTSAPANGWSAIASSADGTRFVAAALTGVNGSSGRVYTSTNFGASWRQTAAPSAIWRSVASSTDGRFLVAAANLDENFLPAHIYTSTNGGDTWTPSSPANNWYAVACSSDGSKIFGAIGLGGIWASTNFGATWHSTTAPTNVWASVASSADGTRVVAAAESNENFGAGRVYLSSDSGTTWVLADLPPQSWSAVVSSADGSRLAAACDGPVYTSTDAGLTWTNASSWIFFRPALASSADGNTLVNAQGGSVMLSFNGGINWASGGAPIVSWAAVTVSADGSRFAAGADGGNIHTLESGAPIVLQQPEGGAIPAGIPITLTVSVFGTAPIQYRWTSNGVPLPDATNATLVLSNLSQSASFRVYVTNSLGNTQSQSAFVSVAPALVLTYFPSISATGAVLRGSVHAAVETLAWFEWGTTTNYGNTTGTTNIAAHEAFTLIESSLGGLTGGTQYFCRVVVSNSYGVVYSAGVQFRPGTAPQIESLTVSSITETGATISAAVNSGGLPTAAFFRWGIDSLNSSEPELLGNGAAPVLLTNVLNGLLPSSVYLYGITASNILNVTAPFQRFLTRPWMRTSLPDHLDWAALASSGDGTRLLAASRSAFNASSRLFVSLDSGATWTNVGPTGDSWNAVAVSEDGTKFAAAAAQPGGLYTSDDLGATWTPTAAPITFWASLALSTNGRTIAAAASSGGLYVSTNSGGSWTTSSVLAGFWESVAVSGDGTRIVAALRNDSQYAPGGIFISTNSGLHWARSSAPSNFWSSVSLSRDGRRIVASASMDTGFNAGHLYVSSDSGASWTRTSAPSGDWNTVRSSADGMRLIAASIGGAIYTSRNGGLMWTSMFTGSFQTPGRIALSADGRQAAAAFDGFGFRPGAYLFHFTPPPMVTILGQPAGQVVGPGTNVSLSVDADGPHPIHYQWQFEGTNILNATNASYSITNASLDHHGHYAVVVTDGVTTAMSSNAMLYVLVPPTIIVTPVGVTNLQGQTATFSVIATGAPPLNFRWLRQGVTYLSNAPATLIITNVQPGVSGSFRVAVTNRAGSVNSAPVQLLVIADRDTDGLPDFWETNYFGNPTNASAMADSDSDNMINRDEFIAGTNPLDPFSVLKLEPLSLGTGSGNVIQFTAASNRSYRVQFSPELDALAWTNLADVNARPSNWTAVITNSTTLAPLRLYRVVTGR